MRATVGRRAFLTAVGVASLAGCLGSPGPSGADRDAPAAEGTERAVGLPPITDPLPLPSSPDALSERAVSGGPPKDGIPAIDEPTFEAADEAAEWLDPDEPVFGVAVESDVKAYPQSILVYHEVCNDVVDGRPVSVTYCPLTGTAMGFLRGETTFGVSGRLVNNNLIMYDRATETWWPQVLATAIPGDWNEDPPTRSLREFRVVWTTWERWRTRHPDTRVLSEDTGHARNYDRDPYGGYAPRTGYYAPDEDPLFPAFDYDDRYPPKDVVVGVRTADGAAAIHKGGLRAAGLVEFDLGGTSHAAVYDEGLDTGYVYRNPEARRLARRDGSVHVDGEPHPPSALPLPSVPAFDAMWFAWAGFYPEATVHA